MSEPSITPVRASSWGRLFDCAHAWEGVHLLGMRKPAGLRTQLGTAIHASTAAFDSGRLAGAEPVSAGDAADVFVQTLHTPRDDVDMSDANITVKEAERIGLSLHARYCADISPRYRFLSVEQKLDPLDIDCGGGILVRLTGSMDRARAAETPNGVVIPDIKSGSRVIENGAVKTRPHLAQVGTYQLLYEHTEKVATCGGQVLALQTSTKPQVQASEVIDAKRVMVGTDEQPGLIEYAAVMFRTGLFPPNNQSILCSERYCARWATCKFHE